MAGHSLAFPVQAHRRESSVRAEVRLLGESTLRKFKGDHLVPVQDLLANGAIDLPPLAREELGRFIEAATKIRQYVRVNPRVGAAQH